MDKKNKRNEETDKKIDSRVKDRGDLKKCNDKTLKKSEGITKMNVNLAYPECGDSVQKSSPNRKPEKMKPDISVKKPTEYFKMKYLISGTNEKEFLNQNNYDKDKLAKSHSELRKRIRDRYTVKLNGPVNKSDHLSLYMSKKDGSRVAALKTDGSKVAAFKTDGSKVAALKTDGSKVAAFKTEGTKVAAFKTDGSKVAALKTDGSKVAALKTDGDKRGLPTRPPTDPAELPLKLMSEETTQTVEKSNPSSSTHTDIDNNPEKIPVKPDKLLSKLAKDAAKKRKPIIKTITSKTGPVRIYKAVTFVDQNNPTPLEIKIPGQVIKKQQKLSKYTETSSLKFKPKVTVSKVSSSKPSSKEGKLTKLAAVRKRAERRRDKKLGHGPSLVGLIKEPPSPPTEVARWAPAAADPHTIPYYEAWINTSLASISKNIKQDKLAYEKQTKLLRCLQKAIEERPESPELFYAKFADEKYAGRIKIRQTERSKKKQQILA